MFPPPFVWNDKWSKFGGDFELIISEFRRVVGDLRNKNTKIQKYKRRYWENEKTEGFKWYFTTKKRKSFFFQDNIFNDFVSASVSR